ncbi:MAG: hypothetical protein HQL58_04055 [Magnetococcales bacterium]|nr:hypothetical protein [Magnetococcales bacterium]
MMHTLLFDLIIALCLVAILLGVGLLGHPDATTGVWRQCPALMASLVARLRMPLRLERYLYRYHRWFGLLVAVISLIVLARLAKPAVDARLLLEPYRAVDPLFYMMSRTLLIFLVLSSLFTLAIGAIVFYRPSVLKHFERWANQPVTPQMIGQWWQVTLQRYPRPVGLLLVVLGGLGWYLLLPYW